MMKELPIKIRFKGKTLVELIELARDASRQGGALYGVESPDGVHYQGVLVASRSVLMAANDARVANAA